MAYTPSQDANEISAKRRRALADQLMVKGQEGAPQDWNRMRVVPSYGIGQGLTQLGASIGGALLGKKADQQLDTIDQAKRQKMADALRGLIPQSPVQPGQAGSGVLRPGQPAPLNPQQEASLSAVGQLPMDTQQQVMGQAAMGNILPQKPAEVSAGASLVNPQTGKEIYHNAAAATGGNSRYGNPQIGPDGKIIVLDRATGDYIDTGKDASANMRLVTLPDGSIQAVDMRKPINDGGAPATAPVVTPQRAGQAVQDRKANEQVGEARGAAIANLPLVQSTAKQALDTVDKLLNHPGRAMGTGLSSKIDPRNYVPGTEAYDFGVLRKQAAGQVFLDAYQALKGGGAITNIEGEKAEQAKARMDAAQSDEQYVAALNDYKGAIQRGLALAEQKTELGTQQPQPQGAPQQSSMPDFTKLSVEQLQQLINGQ